MDSNIELYEALKGYLGGEAARLIAEAVPPKAELATKTDIQLEIEKLRTDFAEFKADMRRWMLAFFVPLWVGVYGTLAAVVVALVLGA